MSVANTALPFIMNIMKGVHTHNAWIIYMAKRYCFTRIRKLLSKILQQINAAENKKIISKKIGRGRTNGETCHTGRGLTTIHNARLLRCAISPWLFHGCQPVFGIVFYYAERHCFTTYNIFVFLYKIMHIMFAYVVIFS